MTDWTDRVSLAFPVRLFGSPTATLAMINRLSEIVDPNTGGADTFTLGWIVDDMFVAASPFTRPFAAFLRADASIWQVVLAKRALEKGVEPLTPDEIVALHNGLMIGGL